MTTPALFRGAAWAGIAIAGAAAFGGIALNRGESINALWFVVAAVSTYLIGYRFYSGWLAARVCRLDATRATPAERLDNGRDFMPTHRSIVFGHHFAAIAGAGPLIGPTLAAQFGYLPGTLWLLVGAVLADASAPPFRPGQFDLHRLGLEVREHRRLRDRRVVFVPIEGGEIYEREE